MSASILPGLLASAPLVGVSGSRAPTAACRLALPRLLALAPGPAVVGCAAGIDAAARQLRPSASVVSASAFGRGRGALAARSVAVVRRVAAAGAPGGPPPVWLSLPGRACPSGLAPSRSPSACFSGRGSGSWASLALAVGLGVPAVVFLPPGVPAPPAWPLQPLGSLMRGSLWLSPPGGVAPSLFA